MKGVIFNLLETVVSDEHGSDTWDDLLDATGLDGVYSGVGQYDDAELHALVGAASTRLDLPADDVVRWFGEHAIPHLAAGYPGFFDQPDLPAFLLSLNSVIHLEVRKLYPGADVPEFSFETGTDRLVLGYTSARKLCMLAEGFITGAARHYGVAVALSQDTCMLRGDPECAIVCDLS